MWMRVPGLAAAVVVLLPVMAVAQSFDGVGTRAAGMGGAFVAVADDASAVYWNPGALASGALFSVTLDRTAGKATLDPPSALGGSRSGTLLALATPPLGLAYYRTRSSWVSPGTGAGPALAQTLVTHQTGITLVQSLLDGLSVGATVKLVRGIAASEAVPTGTAKELLDRAGDLVGRASNTLDADIGLSANFGGLRAGLTIRNLGSPTFQTAEGADALELERQARAGVALMSPRGWLVALDADLNAARGPLGRARQFAVGTEAHVTARALIRAGLHINTLGDEPGGRAPVLSLGASYAAFSSLWLESQATVGSAAGERGWGLAARVAF